MKAKKQDELAARVEALEAQVKAMVEIFRALLPETEVAEADPFSAAFVKFRVRAEERSRVLRGI